MNYIDGTIRSAVEGLATVTVTFQPNIAELTCQLQALPEWTNKTIVDNGSSRGCVEKLEALARSTGTQLILNPTNVGLAAATNIGAKSAKNAGAQLLLILDQDSIPLPGSVETLVANFRALSKLECNVGAVGPDLFDERSNLPHGFHVFEGFTWRRIFPVGRNPIACDALNGSGTLMELDVFLRQGGLDESFFIDHVDTEWSFHLKAAGYTLWGIPHARFLHAMGHDSKRIWVFGWRPWPVRSPNRHFYLYRNAVLLLHRSYVPFAWKIWNIPKLLFTILVEGLFSNQRAEHISQMWRGVAAGFRSRRVARRPGEPAP